jgi:beta-lactamase superfamily II metal-dependent hydrolase
MEEQPMARRKHLALLAFLLLAVAPVVPAQFDAVRVQIVDVGQGDGILIRTPNQRWIVIDAGTNRNMARAMQEEWDVDRLALAIVSHRHFDHHGGMDEVLSEVPVERFFGVTEDCQNTASDDKVRAVLTEKNIPVLPLDTNSPEIDGVRLTFLVPTERAACPEDENNNSVVVRLDYGGFSMLFAGDAEQSERAWLVENHGALLDVDVLKASHHGSHNGTSQDWLDAVTPDHVVISAGVNDTFKHPRKVAVDAYIAETDDRLFCTNRHGTVRVYGFRDGRVRITKQRQTEKPCVYDGTHY